MAVTDAAIDSIRQMIVSGELRPGDRLPKEADLAKRLGLSRSSLREAVKALSLIQVLDVRQGAGTYVTSLEPTLLMGAMEFIVELRRDHTVLQFLEVRKILEPAATAMAAAAMTPEAVAALRSHFDSLEPGLSVEELVEWDLVFHRMIAQGSGNEVICSLLDGLAAPLMRARVWRGLTQDEGVPRTIEEHRAILEAIETRDADVARSWATIHVGGVEQWLRMALDATSSDREAASATPTPSSPP